LEPIPKIDKNIAHWFLYYNDNWITTARLNVTLEQLHALQMFFGTKLNILPVEKPDNT